MLILSRKFNESIIIDGRIIVKVVRLDHDVVKLGIEAPMDVPVHRQEVYDEIQRNNREALTHGRSLVPRLTTTKYAVPAVPPPPPPVMVVPPPVAPAPAPPPPAAQPPVPAAAPPPEAVKPAPKRRVRSAKA
jgi:carbon storage regulator